MATLEQDTRVREVVQCALDMIRAHAEAPGHFCSAHGAGWCDEIRLAHLVADLAREQLYCGVCNEYHADFEHGQIHI